MAQIATKSPLYDDGSANKPLRSEWVYAQLLRAIKAGEFNSGERLREADIAESLGVSRTPVREALARLQHRGLLEPAPGGLVISRLNRLQLIELFAMREVLEGAAASFAAQHASSGEIQNLKHLVQEFKKNIERPQKLADLNHQFHGAIYSAAHNRYLVRTLTDLNDSLTLLPGTTFTLPGRRTKSLREHQLIVDAIAARDAERAKREACQHILNAQTVRLSLAQDSL